MVNDDGVLEDKKKDVWVLDWMGHAGAFAAMALLGRMDQMMAPRGLSFTIAPLGAVCAVLFATPNSPAAQVKTILYHLLESASKM